MERGVKVNGISDMERAFWKGEDDRIQDSETTPFTPPLRHKTKNWPCICWSSMNDRSSRNGRSSRTREHGPEGAVCGEEGID